MRPALIPKNGCKVDISDEGAMWGSKPFKVLHMALAPFKHQITHELENAHYDITIYPTITGDGIPGGINTELERAVAHATAPFFTRTNMTKWPLCPHECGVERTETSGDPRGWGGAGCP